MGVPPLENCTVPVGASPLLCVLRFAVRVRMDPPAPDALEVRVRVVAALVMVMGSAAEMLEAKLESPP